MQPVGLAPVLDTFVHALPYTFRHTEAPDGTQITLEITGVGAGQDAPLRWSLLRHDARWSLYSEHTGAPAAVVTIDADTAWRVFTKGISKADALEQAIFTGDRELGEKVLDTVSIIA